MSEADILFSNCVLIGDHIFFVDTQSGLSAMMDPQNGAVTYCDQFQDYIWRDGDAIDYMGEFDGNAYALETDGDYLAIFDFQRQQCRYIPLACNERKWGNFVAFEKYGSDFFIFPKSGNKVIIFNAKYEKMETTNVLDESGEIQCACRDGNQMWLLSKDGDIIDFFDLSERSWKKYKVNACIKDCADCRFINGNLYLFTQFGILYKWNVGDDKVQEINSLETRHLTEESMGRIVYAGDRLVVFPSFGNDIKSLNLLTGEMKVYCEYPLDFLYYDIGWSKYYGYSEDVNYYYFAMRQGNYFLRVCKTDGEFTWIKPKISNREYKDKLLGLLSLQKCLEEGKRFFHEKNGYLYGWLKHMPNRSNYDYKKTDIGRKIYNEWRMG